MQIVKKNLPRGEREKKGEESMTGGGCGLPGNTNAPSFDLGGNGIGQKAVGDLRGKVVKQPYEGRGRGGGCRPETTVSSTGSKKKKRRIEVGKQRRKRRARPLHHRGGTLWQSPFRLGWCSENSAEKSRPMMPKRNEALRWYRKRGSTQQGDGEAQTKKN